MWGTADSGAEVTVSFGEQSVSTTTGKDGKWMLSLEPLEATFTPQELIVKAGDSNVKLKDIVVGEVWICSGQSNMQASVNAVPEVKALVEIAENVRAFEVPRDGAFEKQDRISGAAWKHGLPDSAVGGSFAYFLQEHADVPVGIILSCWGSTGIEAWMPREMTETVPHFKTIMKEFDANKANYNKVKSILEGGRPLGNRDGVFIRRQSNIVYNAMMHPIIPYACRGLVWYQGERNSKSMHGMRTKPWHERNCGMLNYGDTLIAWIKHYRELWGNDEMNFLTVTLPGYYIPIDSDPIKDHLHPEAHSFAWMRESQLKGQQTLDHVYASNSIDLGHITNLHPKDKLPIGQRLAFIAAKETLGKDIPAYGPVYEKLEKKDGELIVHFNNAEGLKTTDEADPKGFWIADDSRKWHPAKAVISGSSVKLSAPEVENPLHVRYAFSGKPEVNLINAADLPAYPFRTDDFPPLPGRKAKKR